MSFLGNAAVVAAFAVYALAVPMPGLANASLIAGGI